MEGLTSQLVDSLVLVDFVVGSPQGKQDMGDLCKGRRLGPGGTNDRDMGKMLAKVC